VILEAANYDPLRAQEIEERVDAEWWSRWLTDRNERIGAANKERKKHASKK
jgi:hypothetical protein